MRVVLLISVKRITLCVFCYSDKIELIKQIKSTWIKIYLDKKMDNIIIKFDERSEYDGYIYNNWNDPQGTPPTIDLVGLACMIEIPGEQPIRVEDAKVLNWHGSPEFYCEKTGLVSFTVEQLCEFGLNKNAEIRNVT
jgi:hypothetical protein